ncbi:Small heat shock protein IbpA [secondary endosymbiont of Trabutina mannipara]|uniref:Small heat shock protein IbpA n=1 Tax=secondary endosymbiont of Trabutina mannipara TaxID=1835721 RepID=A0A1C3L433_9ENTR|nr:small heat shock chaperone IbpA [secondary endosymbiont of Trabutina mannipara]SBT82037.1 Small heat shock protein IbpA [secondary endosymbiont of Trabutina mannipara]
MRNFDFSPLYRSAIGFDRLVNLLEASQNKGSNSYPPYNVELVSENKYRVSIAVAGFAEKELDITAHDNIMTIKGVHTSENNQNNYLYQSIEDCNFERKFQLSEFIQIKGAHLVNGLLFIDLERIMPETLKPRRIEIN